MSRFTNFLFALISALPALSEARAEEKPTYTFLCGNDVRVIYSIEIWQGKSRISFRNFDKSSIVSIVAKNRLHPALPQYGNGMTKGKIPLNGLVLTWTETSGTRISLTFKEDLDNYGRVSATRVMATSGDFKLTTDFICQAAL